MFIRVTAVHVFIFVAALICVVFHRLFRVVKLPPDDSFVKLQVAQSFHTKWCVTRKSTLYRWSPVIAYISSKTTWAWPPWWPFRKRTGTGTRPTARPWRRIASWRSSRTDCRPSALSPRTRCVQAVCVAEVAGVAFSGSAPLSKVLILIRIRKVFKFENPTPVQTPATIIDQTEFIHVFA